MSDFGVVLFHTTSAAFRAEKTLAKNGLIGKLVPTPRQFSSDCGMALRFGWSEVDRVRALLGAARVEIAALHAL
jgi:hypothetical protein